MKKTVLLFLLLGMVWVPERTSAGGATKKAQKTPPAETVDMKVLDPYFPIRAFCVRLPEPSLADDFIGFVRNDLIPSGINTLIIRVDWTFDFQKHPELIADGAWSGEKIKELVAVCRQEGMEIVPLMNLLGHQSWHGRPGKLLEQYPQFDEKPHVKYPEEYVWPNSDRLYCKSYCPNHPDVHKIVFDCVDEVIEAFEAKDFHAGMDEVFDIADPNCPRCKGLDPAAVFAGEVNKISSHLAQNGVRLWIWADRLLDGRNDASGYGEWSASITNTHRAIDMIDRNVMMCDWHYRDAEQSPVLFAIKGYSVITCGWERPDITELQLEDMLRFRTHSSNRMSQRFMGYMQTVWSSYRQFIDEYRNGSDKKEYSADNYRYLKQSLAEYAKQFAGESQQKKEATTVFGQ